MFNGTEPLGASFNAALTYVAGQAPNDLLVATSTSSTAMIARLKVRRCLVPVHCFYATPFVTTAEI